MHKDATGAARCPPSYYALRVCPRADAREWWAAARLAADAPPAIRAILAGRARVALTAEEARTARSWAQDVDGWNQDGLAAVWIYPSTPA